MSVALRDFSPKDYPVRLPGHGLHAEGAPHSIPGCSDGECRLARNDRPVRNQRRANWDGHAVCECGVTSEHLTSNGQRKRWHRDHKREAVS